MKPLYTLPFLSLAILAAVACEDSTSTEPAAPDGGTIPNTSSGNDAGSSGDGAVASKCPAPTGAPLAHTGTIAADETWGAGLHDVTFDIDVRKGATLTIAPCAVVRVVASRGFSIGTGNVGDGGRLVAKGQADMPIVIQGADGARWNHILVSSLGFADLAYVTIKDSGGPYSRGGGALHLFGDQYKPIQELATVDHVTIEDSAKYGAILEGRGAFSPASQMLTVRGAGDMALRVNAPALGTVPAGSYTGNTNDGIRVSGSGGYDIIDADVTIHDRGVPYVIGGDGQFNEMSVVGKDTAAPLLTIEPGVTLKFGKTSSGLFIERASTTNAARGALRAIGTADKPIVFTSAEATPAAGDWTGIHFNGLPDPRDAIEYARVEYAGANTGTRGFSCGTPPSPDPISNEAAIAIFGQPTSAFIKNTTFVKSAANGIERAWVGTPVDFLPSNTFTEIAYCRQTYPRPAAGSCPVPAPCD